MNKILSLLFVVFISSCGSVSSSDQSVVACGVTYGFVVNPSGELTDFKLFLPPTCSKEGLKPELSNAWKKTACAHFSTYNLQPTYELGQPEKMLYGNYFYRPSRPNVLYPTVNAGDSENDPVIYIQESILESNSEKKHVCDEDLVSRI